VRGMLRRVAHLVHVTDGEAGAPPAPARKESA
jgi:hypothetical protein